MMRYQLLNGKTISKSLRDHLKDQIKQLKENQTKEELISIENPHLAVILVGNDEASQIYIKQKQKACLEVGIGFTLHQLPKNTETSQVIKVIDKINNDESIHGLIIQLPLPSHIDTDLVINSVAVFKDVDGFHPFNIGKLALNKTTFIPATPYGIQLMLEHYKVETRGKHCVIIGKSLIVGQPLMNLISLETGMAATVTCCDRYTENLENLVKMADILIVACGKHHLISNPNWIKEGCVIIDVGIHRIEDDSRKNGYRLEGDVDFHTIKEKCSLITPVPGGVGPMTVIGLLLNTWNAYLQQIKI